MTRRRLVVALLAMTSLLATAGCAGGPVPHREVSAVAPSPAGAVELTEPPQAPPQPDCGDPTAQSLRPPAQLPPPGNMPAGSTMARIQANGKLVVGVDQTTYNFGYRDPSSGEIVGFDIDMARAIAKAIFGDEKAVRLRAITSSQRIDVLRDGEVDIVIRTMSITCDRLEKVDFSSVYYQAGQRVLVKRNSDYTGLESLGDRKVCATKDSTSLRNIANAESGPIAVQVPNWTDCLVMLQQNQVDAVSTDDTILAGLAAQDPSTHVVGQPTHLEPYGMAMPKGQEDFVRFVNGVIEQVRTDGRWVNSYRKWMQQLLRVPAVPPVARYRS